MTRALVSLPLVLSLGLAGCVTDPTTGRIDWTASITKADQTVRTYAPIIGKNLLMIGDILVQAECSPALSASSQTAVNILSIVAPTSAKAATVQSALQTNVKVAAELCPLVQAIQAKVGTVPAGVPVQTIPAS